MNYYEACVECRSVNVALDILRVLWDTNANTDRSLLGQMQRDKAQTEQVKHLAYQHDSK